MGRVDFDSELGDTYMRMYTAMKKGAPQNIRSRPAVNPLEKEDAQVIRVRAERFVTGYTGNDVVQPHECCIVCGQLLADIPSRLVRQVWYNSGGRTDYYKHATC